MFDFIVCMMCFIINCCFTYCLVFWCNLSCHSFLGCSRSKRPSRYKGEWLTLLLPLFMQLHGQPECLFLLREKCSLWANTQVFNNQKSISSQDSLWLSGGCVRGPPDLKDLELERSFHQNKRTVTFTIRASMGMWLEKRLSLKMTGMSSQAAKSDSLFLLCCMHTEICMIHTCSTDEIRASSTWCFARNKLNSVNCSSENWLKAYNIIKILGIISQVSI